MVPDRLVDIDASEEAHTEADNDFIPYILECVKSFEAGAIDTSTMVKNLSAAIVLQYVLMELSGVTFRQESAASLTNSESYSVIQKLFSNLCFTHYKGELDILTTLMHFKYLNLAPINAWSWFLAEC